MSTWVTCLTAFLSAGRDHCRALTASERYFNLLLVNSMELRKVQVCHGATKLDSQPANALSVADIDANPDPAPVHVHDAWSPMGVRS